MRLMTSTLLCLALSTACGTAHQAPAPTPTSALEGIQTYTGLSHAHLGKGDYPQSYAQSPPVGGPHSPAWLKCAVYTVALPKENAVHSLEHGAVWITYQPELPADQVALLGQYAALNREYVMVSPYTGQDSPVIVSTWGVQLKVAAASDPRIRDFITTYAGGNQGGEKGVRCASTGVTLQQALDYDASQR